LWNLGRLGARAGAFRPKAAFRWAFGFFRFAEGVCGALKIKIAENQI
jgi:hypothetical protein